MDRPKDRPPVEWERAVKEFSEGGVTLQVDRLPLGKPRFSFSIGVVREGRQENSFTSRMSARYAYEDGVVTFEGLPPSGAVDRLVEEARRWIEAEVLAAEARYAERQQRRGQPDSSDTAKR